MMGVRSKRGLCDKVDEESVQSWREKRSLEGGKNLSSTLGTKSLSGKESYILLTYMSTAGRQEPWPGVKAEPRLEKETLFRGSLQSQLRVYCVDLKWNLDLYPPSAQ